MEIGIKDIRMFNKLPNFVILQGKKYKINADFRAMISFERILEDRNIADSEKVKMGLQIFYPYFFYHFEEISDISLYKEACEKLIWFYTCGNRENYHPKTEGKPVTEKVLDYKYDDEYIYAAFYKIGVDLSKDFVHWWKFRALFKGLNKDVINSIMEARSYDGDEDYMKKKKEYWKLPDENEKIEQERLNALYEALK